MNLIWLSLGIQRGCAPLPLPLQIPKSLDALVSCKMIYYLYTTCTHPLGCFKSLIDDLTPNDM